ncbi:hypothetical protein [Mycolicibacter terrae]|uniref:hypothetical protein n=1 Tax=Mycolicibacter terrae TaxID=1788 RepID=UPI000B94E491|nr:hypothetical protein [Mycolicibacter terrae]SNV68655.1 Uncharacterised protein [Mycolicibacter terrae]
MTVADVEARVRAEYAELLNEIGGGRVQFSPDESAMVDAGVRLACRIAMLEVALAAEAGGAEPDPAILVRLSAEIRASEKESVLMWGRVRRGLERTVAAAGPAASAGRPAAVRGAGHNGGRRNHG